MSGDPVRLAALLALALAGGLTLAAASQEEPLEARVVRAEAEIREGEADLVAQARAALDEAARRRAAGDAAGAARAERIGETALELVRVRRARDEATAARDAARARRAEMEARLAAARSAVEAAEHERDRLAGTAP